jgi:hypothetical protein
MMYLLNRKLLFLAGLTLCCAVIGYTQTVTSIRDGLWTDPSVWDAGQVPTLATASETVINHAVIIPTASVITIQNAVVNNSLTLATGSIVDLIPDGLPAKRDLQVVGTLTIQDGAVLNGTSIANTSFESGARYIHLQGPLGYIPYATWNSNSTFEIAGFKTQGYINIAHSDSWKQNFGHVIYNCAQQTTAFVDLNGYLRNIGGNLIVQSTNNQALRLSTTQSPTITIAGDFIIEGPSKIWFSTNPPNAIINVQRDFRYRSSSNGISYLTTKGVITVNVQGEMEMNSPGRFHMASTSLDSTGSRMSTLSLRGDFTVTAGSIVGPPSPGKGKINFVGSAVQNVTTPSSVGTFQGILDYLIENGSTVNMKNSVISNSNGTLTVKGKLQLGSSDPGGAIQFATGGNIQVQGSRTFMTGCTIEYNGLTEQWIGSGHPSSQGVHLICSNPAGVTMLKGVVASDVTILGKFNTQAFPLTVYGNITIAPELECTIERLNVQGGLVQQISAAGATFKNLVIDKSGNAATLSSPLKISQSLAILSTNTTLYSKDNLILLSTSDVGSATASVGTLPAGSFIDGSVTVQRHMDGEGRIYRYISSPIQNGSISSLKDDFPITGRFQDPSTGPGLRPTWPSFYYYDESRGGLQESWIPYPTSGLSSSNPLVVGKGYAAYIQTGNSPLVWDVTGPLNQGTLALPVNFTASNQAAMGWNLVGNPYACAIQWDDDGADKWTIENISSVIAIRDNGSGGGTFRYWDLGDGDPEIPVGQIATGQAFWVRATAINPKLIIREGVKVIGGATFFRKEQSVVPSFALELSRDALNDIAYFKIRPSSKPGLDNWDGVKLDNDNFDISFISADKQSLAIHATDRFPCDTTIQIGLKDLVPGWYKLRLITKYDFSRYQYTMRDKFLRTETLLTADEATPLVVTSDPASFAYDRISLHMVERELKSNIEIHGDNAACTDSVVKLIAKNAEPGIYYSIWNTDQLLTSIKADKGGELEFRFPAGSLLPGQYNLRLQAQSNCHINSQVTSHSLAVDTNPRVWADSIAICPGNSAKLTASSDRSDVLFSWFADDQSRDTLAFANVLETPPLIKPQVFYVAATTSAGCSSDRYRVKVNLKIMKVAEISWQADTILASNFDTNNSWYLNEKKIEGETGSSLTLGQSGVYVLRVDTLDCISEDTFEYILLNVESSSTEMFYPNPVQETLLLHDVRNEVTGMDLFDSLGKWVMTWEHSRKDPQGVYTIEISCLPDGIYVGVLTTSRGKKIVRFGKKRE